MKRERDLELDLGLVLAFDSSVGGITTQSRNLSNKFIHIFKMRGFTVLSNAMDNPSENSAQAAFKKMTSTLLVLPVKL